MRPLRPFHCDFRTLGDHGDTLAAEAEPQSYRGFPERQSELRKEHDAVRAQAYRYWRQRGEKLEASGDRPRGRHLRRTGQLLLDPSAPAPTAARGLRRVQRMVRR